MPILKYLAYCPAVYQTQTCNFAGEISNSICHEAGKKTRRSLSTLNEAFYRCSYFYHKKHILYVKISPRLAHLLDLGPDTKVLLFFELLVTVL